MNLNDQAKRTCEFSPCRKWRYTLWREWDDQFWGLADDRPNANQYLMVIGLNPSTADETNDDPTIRRCITFAKRWGFGALCMTNIFAWRDTLPSNMKKAADPVGPDNDRWLKEIADGAGMILAAWGTHGKYRNRAADVTGRVLADYELFCLKQTQDGSPGHPLYIPADTRPARLAGCGRTGRIDL